MKKPEPCARAECGRPWPSGKFGTPKSRKNRSNGGLLKNGGRFCSCPFPSFPGELKSSGLVWVILTRTEITAGLTLRTTGAKLRGPDGPADCGGAVGAVVV